MNYSFKSTVHVGDINLSKWAEGEGEGQLIRGCPLREAVETRRAGPAGLRLPSRRPGVGQWCGQRQALLAQGEPWPMAGGPDHLPARGPGTEWPQTLVGAALTHSLGDVTWERVWIGMSELPQSLSPQPRLAPGPYPPQSPTPWGSRHLPLASRILPAARSTKPPARCVPATKTLCPFHQGRKQNFLTPGEARWRGGSDWLSRGERAEGPELEDSHSIVCRACVWGLLNARRGRVAVKVTGSHSWRCPSQSVGRQKVFQGKNGTCPRPHSMHS